MRNAISGMLAGRAVQLASVALLCGASPLSAQQSTLTFRGQTLDSAGRAVAGVDIRLTGSSRTTISDSSGFFRFESVPAGALALDISHPGFVSLTLSLPVQRRDTTAIPVLLLSVEPAFADEPSDGMVFGRVTNTAGEPVRDVELTFPASGLVTRSDSLGRYGASITSRDTQRVQLRKIGYAPQTLTIRPGTAGALRVDVTLGQLTMQLAQTVVRRTRSMPRIREFYSRMTMFGDAQFLTRAQIDPTRYSLVTDLLGRMRGVHIDSNDSGKPVPQSGMRCTMRVLFNGQEVDLDIEALNSIVRVRDLVGVEVYNASTQVPQEFKTGFAGSSANARCGAIGLWTI